LAFHPRQSMLVTAASDRTFKLWVEAPRPYAPTMKTAREAPPPTYWVCQSVGTYRDYKVRGATFSPDGSLLAVVYGQVITLWEPATLTLRHTLSIRNSNQCFLVEHIYDMLHSDGGKIK
jgi:NET1-associated nuclear protein 1 (U3 small nucleolar RNA-associated protein 17)